MPRTVLPILSVLVCITLVGCSERTKVGSDYELVQPESLLMESGKPACSLYYKKNKIWNAVESGSDKTCHNGVFVFIAHVIDSYGRYDYDVSPQLYAIRGAGPAIMISERILNRSIQDSGAYVAWKITPNTNGLIVGFVSKTNASNVVNFDVSWLQIQNWVKEADNLTSKEITTSLGNYIILPPTNSAAH